MLLRAMVAARLARSWRVSASGGVSASSAGDAGPASIAGAVFAASSSFVGRSTRRQGRIVGEPALPRGAIEIEQPFEAELDRADRARQNQIEQARGEEDREEIEGRGRELRRAQRQFLHRDDGGKRGILQRADRLVAEGRDHGADRLRRDDPAHQHGRRHAERLTGQELAAIDAEHAGAQHFRDERRLVAGEREAGGHDGGQLDADMRQRVVGEHHLQDQRRAAEDHRVSPRECGEQPEAAELHPREDQAEEQSADQPEGSDLQGQLNAFEQIRQTEVVKEQRHQSTERMSGSLKLFTSSSHFFRRSMWVPVFCTSISAARTASRKAGLSFGTAMPTE